MTEPAAIREIEIVRAIRAARKMGLKCVRIEKNGCVIELPLVEAPPLAREKPVLTWGSKERPKMTWHSPSSGPTLSPPSEISPITGLRKKNWRAANRPAEMRAVDVIRDLLKKGPASLSQMGNELERCCYGRSGVGTVLDQLGDEVVRVGVGVYALRQEGEAEPASNDTFG